MLTTFLTIFITVFLAELGDKTQIATMLFAAKENSNYYLIFFASSLALILSTVIAIFAGNLLNKYIDPSLLTKLAGVGFILIGIWTIFKK